MNLVGGQANLTGAAARFLAALAPEQRQQSQQELNKFVRWFGGDRPLAALTAPEVENYCLGVAASTNDAAEKLEPLKAFLGFAVKERLIVTNLATHVRIRKTPVSKSARRAVSTPTKSVTVTADSYAALQAEIKELKGQRPRIAQELRRAMADKDFRENAPLDATREQQAQLEAKIRQLEATLQAAVVVKDSSAPSGRSGLGSTLRIIDLTTQENMQYTLVSPSEVNAARGKISAASPLGKALQDRVPGDVVEVAAPGGKIVFRIEEISG